MNKINNLLFFLLFYIFFCQAASQDKIQQKQDEEKKIEFIKNLDDPNLGDSLDLSKKKEKDLFENSIIRQTEIVLFISVPLVVFWNNTFVLNNMQGFSSLSSSLQKDEVKTSNDFRYDNDNTLVNSLHPFHLFAIVNTIAWTFTIAFDFFQTYNNPENKDIFRITSEKEYNQIFYQANFFRHRF